MIRIKLTTKAIDVYKYALVVSDVRKECPLWLANLLTDKPHTTTSKITVLKPMTKKQLDNAATAVESGKWWATLRMILSLNQLIWRPAH